VSAHQGVVAQTADQDVVRSVADQHIVAGRAGHVLDSVDHPADPVCGSRRQVICLRDSSPCLNNSTTLCYVALLKGILPPGAVPACLVSASGSCSGGRSTWVIS
jgi:hypothetical protein